MRKSPLQRGYLYAAVSAQSGLPMEFLDTECAESLLDDTANHINRKLIGQNQAIDQMQTVLRSRLSERAADWRHAVETLEPAGDRRPLGCFLAVGPTGVGKTETARLIAERFYCGRIITLNASEVGPEAPHGVATWVGSPPGYVGYNQGGSLTDGLRSHKACVILVDEIEKASHEAIQNILLPLMGDGVVTDRNNGDALYATECIVFATSNLSVSEQGETGIGFRNRASTSRSANVFSSLSEHLLPEIIGRFNAVLVYHPLSEEGKWIIFQRLLEELQERHQRRTELDAAAVERIKEQLRDCRTGARGIADLIQRHCVP